MAESTVAARAVDPDAGVGVGAGMGVGVGAVSVTMASSGCAVKSTMIGALLRSPRKRSASELTWLMRTDEARSVDMKSRKAEGP